MTIDRITDITLDEKALLRSEHFREKRERAVTDLLKHNKFKFGEVPGPYQLEPQISQNMVVFSILGSDNSRHSSKFSLTALRNILKDYAIICDNYFEAVKFADPSKVEAIDMGRRAMHNEGAELLVKLIGNKIEMDFETARKLFTLVYVLQLKK